MTATASIAAERGSLSNMFGSHPKSPFIIIAE